MLKDVHAKLIQAGLVADPDDKFLRPYRDLIRTRKARLAQQQESSPVALEKLSWQARLDARSLPQDRGK